MVVVQLVQLSLYQWELKSPKGTVIVSDLAFASQYKAEEWVKSYISSFMGWDYEIIYLTRGVK